MFIKDMRRCSDCKEMASAELEESEGSDDEKTRRRALDLADER